MMTKDNIKKILFICAAVIVMLTVAFNINAVFAVIGNFFSIIQPIIIGFCLAFILNLIMSQFESNVYSRLSTDKKPRRVLVRILSLVSTLLVFAAIIALVLLVIVPQVSKTAAAIAAGVPSFAIRATQFIRNTLAGFGVTPDRISNIILGGEAYIDKLIEFAQNNVNGFVKSLLSIGGEVVGTTSDIFFGIFIAIYFLVDKDRVIRQCKRFIRAVLKEKIYSRASYIGTLATKSFTNFISGQCIEALVLGTLCFIGMLIFGFPYAPIVAVIIAVTALVPIVGAWVGGGLSAILILISSPTSALWFLVFFIVLQQLEGNFIYPRVVGKKVGLPGVWVLLAVVIGSGLMGAIGALLSVPIASVLYVLASEYVFKSEKENDRPLE